MPSDGATARFADHYRKLALPRVRHAVAFNAVAVALGDISFGEAVNDTIRGAWLIGGSHLPAKLWDDLVFHILNWLVEAVESASARASEAASMADKVAIDLTRFFETADLYNSLG